MVAHRNVDTSGLLPPLDSARARALAKRRWDDPAQRAQQSAAMKGDGNPRRKAERTTPMPAAAPDQADAEPLAVTTGREGGKRSAAVRKARSIKAQAIEVSEATDLQTLADLPTEEDGTLSHAARIAAHAIARRIVAGSIPIRHGTDAASAIKALHDIVRLEGGLPTSVSASITVDREALVRAAQESYAQAHGSLSVVPAQVRHDEDDATLTA